VWDEDGVRDDVRALLVEHLGDPAAVLVVDETGDLKKGSHTVGVARQYTGTAGKVDNAQVAVYLTYATTSGHGVIDRELYLPQGLAGRSRTLAGRRRPRPGRLCDQARADPPDARARAGRRGAGRLGDRRRGLRQQPGLRGWLEAHQLPYVLAVKATEPLPSASGPSVPAARLAEQVPPECWLRISAGHGAKGRRWYAWTVVVATPASGPRSGLPLPPTGQRTVKITICGWSANE
jgi:DDE superfamily endonuclease